MLIPPRRLSRWSTVDGTDTTYAGAAPLVANRGAFESGLAEVVMAYPKSDRSQGEGIRLDFRWVVQFLYTSFWARDPAQAAGIEAATRIFALNVLDDSPMVHNFSSGYSDPESWEPVFGNHQPVDLLRHFHIAFDDFGMYDVLAVDCVARTFSLSSSEEHPLIANLSPVQRAAEQARRESLLLADATVLEPLPPIVTYPFEPGSPG